MLSTVHTPRTKQDLMKAIQAARVQIVTVFETHEVLKLPSVKELIHKKATVVVLVPPK